MIRITAGLEISDNEIQLTFIRASGPGGQNVNKVATAVLLRFDVLHSSSLPDNVRIRLLQLTRNQISQEGVLYIKASRFRTQERNKQDAISRLIDYIRRAATPPKPRKKTKITKAMKQRRLNQKKLLSQKKTLRRNSEY